jgi:hypothetical protein
MFETLAALGTLACIAIFVTLVVVDRAGRRDEAEKAAPRDMQP